MITEQTPLAETDNFIILDHYEREWIPGRNHQSEADLEREFVGDLVKQGYEFVKITKPEALRANVRVQLEALNSVKFLDSEWQRFVKNYLDAPSDHIVEKTRKIHDNYIHDFIFDDGHIQNIYILDKKNFELKRRGVAIREAFNQVHRYSKESFNSETSLFKYLQIFVISNGTDTRYFGNTTKRDKNSFDFSMNWAMSNNERIFDLQDFTATFFQKNTLLNVLLQYSVFDANDTLLILRPYQVAATERILRKIKSSYQTKN